MQLKITSRLIWLPSSKVQVPIYSWVNLMQLLAQVQGKAQTQNYRDALTGLCLHLAELHVSNLSISIRFLIF